MAENFRWVALTLAAIISLIFLLQLLFPPITDELSLDSSRILERPWTLVTYIFLHGSFSHLYSNMFALALFGSLLEKAVGFRNFLKVFFLTGVVSGLASIFFYSSVIGASGAIFGVIGVLGVLRPKMVVWAIGVPMPMIVVLVVYSALNLAGAFYPSDIAYVGHISALAAGIAIGLIWRSKYRVVEKKRKKVKIDDGYFRRWEDEYMKKKIIALKNQNLNRPISWLPLASFSSLPRF
jgi:membrane associated rhomboid family serine protease